MKHPNPLMLLRIAQGDAFGMAAEYLKFPRDDAVKEAVLKFERYCKHPTHNLKAGQYTDDTQMSVAVAEVLIGRHEWQGEGDLRRQLADAFVDCFKRDPRDGYARGFQAFLASIKNGAEFLAKINPESDKNGAAMRSVPIGVLPTPVAG